MTSPPFALLSQKEYGNVSSSEYLEWFRPFALEIFRCLKDSGSFVIDLGGAWNKKLPTKSLYNFKILIMLCEEIGFSLAQDFYWYNPVTVPGPAEWTSKRRIRGKSAVNTIWWLSKTEWPKASNVRVAWPYSDAMVDLINRGKKFREKHPSGHAFSNSIRSDNGASICPNLIAVANNEANSFYQKYCDEQKINAHPARFPEAIPEFFIRMLTDRDDIVVDPFAGSCVTGAVAQQHGRKWFCIDTNSDYLRGAVGRFTHQNDAKIKNRGDFTADDYYKIPRPDLLWNRPNGDNLPRPGTLWYDSSDNMLPLDGGKNYKPRPRKKR